MPNSVKSPEFVEFSAVPTIEAAAGEKELPRFSMVAYSGGAMRLAGFPHAVVVDLGGLDVPDQSVPIRLDHKPSQGVGHTTRIEARGGKLVAEGLISRDTSWARDVARSGSNGFPWRASIGGPVIKAEFVSAGRNIEVNGQSFEGPLHVVRRMTLKEISFVDNGADSDARAVVSAQSPEEEKQNMPKANEDKKEASADKKSNVTDTPEKLEASGAGQVDVEAIRAEGEERARKRFLVIDQLCSEHPDIRAQALEEKWDEDRCAREVRAAIQESRPSAPAVHVPADTFGPQVFEVVALSASGVTTATLEASYSEQTLEAADKLRGVDLQEFCELASGERLPRYRRDATGWLRAAFSTTSLPNILANVANKSLLEGYNYVEDAWRRICKIASVNDFKEHSRYRMTDNFVFQKVGPDGELKHGKVGEQQFGQKVDTHGIMFALTRQMIINDDLGALTEIPRRIGMGAAEAIADAVWGLFLSNPVQSDGLEFFHADHNNYLAGADTALTIDGLTMAEVAFAEQTKPNGRPLGVPARLLLVPTALKVPAEQLMTALQVNETTTANKAKPANNPHAGKFEVVSSAYPSNTTFPGASNKAWHLLADPNRLPAIEVAFLGGVDRPTVERADADFNTLGVQYRGYIDFGVREQDYRGALKMKGES